MFTPRVKFDLLVVFAIFFFQASAGSVRGQDDLSPEDSLKAAERLEKEGSLAKAQEIYEKFLAAHANHIQAPDTRYKLGVLYDHRGDPDKCVAMLTKALEGEKAETFKHRADAFMHLGKLQASLNRHEDAVETFTRFLEEGAGLYEDEVYNLCGGYHAIVGNNEKAAAMFNILARRPGGRFTQEAGYKLAVVWLKAGKIDLATKAVEDFARANPGHPRTPSLFMRIARHYYDTKEYRKTAAVCEQLRTRFAASPEASRALYLIALCAKGEGQMDRAANSLVSLAKTFGARDREMAVEALFEAAQIYRKDLDNKLKAMELYEQTASAVRDNPTPRERQIQGFCYFQLAENQFAQENWRAALDLYLLLNKVSPEVDVNGRILQCKSRLGDSGGAAITGDTPAEIEFIRSRIAKNPGTLLAAQGEVYLIDRELARALEGRARNPWGSVDETLTKYQKVLGDYDAKLLDSDHLRAYVYKQMAFADGASLSVEPEKRPADTADRAKRAIKNLEAGLALDESANAPYKVAMLESLARLSHHVGDDPRAFSIYKQLHWLSSERPSLWEEDDQAVSPFAYVKSMSGLAKTDDMINEVVALLEATIAKVAPGSAEGRDARFQLADLYFLKRRYSEAAQTYREFVDRYGPKQDASGEVTPEGKKPKAVNTVLLQVYDAAVRVAHSYHSQGNQPAANKAYAWVTRNLPVQNPHLAESWYYVASAMPENDEAAKEEKARALWRNLVNPSMDFGSKVFDQSFHPWTGGGVNLAGRSEEFVRTGTLKAGELFSEVGRHQEAVGVFTQFLKFRRTGEGGSRNSTPILDEKYRIARYALGRELIAIGDLDQLAEVYRAYIDTDREDRFRASGLMMLGHYGTQGELFEDAAGAYEVLLDEFGPPNAVDGEGVPIPVPVEERLRKKSRWNGIRMKPPEGFDSGTIRFSLGYLYWKKEDYPGCIQSLNVFLEDVTLSENKNRPQALLMLGRSHEKAKQYAEAVSALDALVSNYPDFTSVEETSVDLARCAYRGKVWKGLDRAYQNFVSRYSESDRRPYMDLFAAAAMLQRGDPEGGMARLRDLAGADTFEDVKADANYHIGKYLMSATPPDAKGAQSHLRKSVDLFPRADALLQAGKSEAALGNWRIAMNDLDRLLREFPSAEPATLTEAEKLLNEAKRKVAEEESR